jgi:probable phosphoglycerate mutase
LYTILYLIRHGQTDWNQLRRYQGHSDVQLNETGVRQAEKVAARFVSEPVDAVYASDLSRARETARRIAEGAGCSFATLPALRERCYGEWEGLTHDEIRRRFRDRDEASCGIETFEAMQRRAVSVLSELAENHRGQTLVVVSHGGFINSFLHYVTNGEQGPGITRIDNTSVNVFRYGDSGWEVLRINDTDHLEK